MTPESSTPAPESDVRPVVRTAASGNRSLWLFGGLLLVFALLLFQALNARRAMLATPATQVVPSDGAIVTAPPPLQLPPRFPDGYQQDEQLLLPASRPALIPPAAPQPVATRIVERAVPVPREATLPPSFPPPQSYQTEAPAQTVGRAPPEVGPDNDRVLAGRLRNPSFTVPQGTVIAAVLETALDSTRPGGARAIVQRDVMGFDGTRVLIPRGSRLYGEYSSDVSAGQKRALIRWQRLTRPDAVIVNLDSPAADPLGRAGVEGEVDSHFFARFGGAILQSVLNIGVGLATRSASHDAYVLALPPTTQAIAGIQPEPVRPTLRVGQGTSVSVFVARDLDFSTVDQ